MEQKEIMTTPPPTHTHTDSTLGPVLSSEMSLSSDRLVTESWLSPSLTINWSF